ncbi:MAG: hypothetical protein JST21_03795 [Bacteroidetes bacterium]|nr:hypothetical protein [Bacteroidota bacterium]
MTEEFNKIIKGEICPYCNCETELVSGEFIYPYIINEQPRPKYLDKKYYVCKLNRNHYVGTYSDNKKSLGRLADTELRKLKHEGHNIFDPLWKNKTHFKSQKEAYNWLSEVMNLPLEFTHFGMFTNEQCINAIKYCNNLISS